MKKHTNQDSEPRFHGEWDAAVNVRSRGPNRSDLQRKERGLTCQPLPTWKLVHD